MQEEKLYELAYLASPSLDDAGLGALKNDIDSLIVKLGGSIREQREAERRRLAYPVKKEKNAYLVTQFISLPASARLSLGKELQFKKEILRLQFLSLTDKFISRLRERRTVDMRPSREAAKDKVTAAYKRPAAVEKPAEEKKADIAEIEKKLDEILGREL